MRTTHLYALNNVTLGLGTTEFADENQETLVAVGSSYRIMDVHNFADRMNVDHPLSRNWRDGYQLDTAEQKYMALMEYFPDDISFSNPVGMGSTTPNVGTKTIQAAVENVSKAMMIAILDNNGKRSSTVGIGSTFGRKNKFFNCIVKKEYRGIGTEPWATWNEPVGVCTPTSISRSNNVAIVTTTPAHGMSTSYDDWGISMNLNTGIATSFNISTSFNPNGVPIKIIDANTFSYNNVGINTPTTAVVGIASIQVGWGGTSNNMRILVL
tara:strand:- start:177 stop:980 length:804 start_codon:yes stop_codon:yes gene_type:complete